MSRGYDPDLVRKQLRGFRIARMYRIVHRKHRDSPLAAVPAPSRFSDPAGRFAVLYAAEAVRCSFWETLARNRFAHRDRRALARAEVAARLVISFRSTAVLNLVDLRRDGPIRIAAPTAVTHDGNHAAGRSLSAAVYSDVSEADGFLFDSRFTGHRCVAIFDRGSTRLEVLEISPLLEHADFLDALDEYDIELSEPPQ